MLLNAYAYTNSASVMGSTFATSPFVTPSDAAHTSTTPTYDTRFATLIFVLRISEKSTGIYLKTQKVEPSRDIASDAV